MNIEHRIMNDEGLNASIAFFGFDFDIHYSVFGVHDSINDGPAAL